MRAATPQRHARDDAERAARRRRYAMMRESTAQDEAGEKSSVLYSGKERARDKTERCARQEAACARARVTECPFFFFCHRLFRCHAVCFCRHAPRRCRRCCRRLLPLCAAFAAPPAAALRGYRFHVSLFPVAPPCLRYAVAYVHFGFAGYGASFSFQLPLLRHQFARFSAGGFYMPRASYGVRSALFALPISLMPPICFYLFSQFALPPLRHFATIMLRHVMPATPITPRHFLFTDAVATDAAPLFFYCRASLLLRHVAAADAAALRAAFDMLPCFACYGFRCCRC